MSRLLLSLVYFWSLACPVVFAQPQVEPAEKASPAKLMQQGAASEVRKNILAAPADKDPVVARVRQFLSDYTAAKGGNSGEKALAVLRQYDDIAKDLKLAPGLRTQYFPGAPPAAPAGPSARARLDSRQAAETVGVRAAELNSNFRTSEAQTMPAVYRVPAQMGTFRGSPRSDSARIIPVADTWSNGKGILGGLVPDAAPAPDPNAPPEGQKVSSTMKNIGVGGMAAGALVGVGMVACWGTGACEVTLGVGVAAFTLFAVGAAIYKAAKPAGKINETLSNATRI